MECKFQVLAQFLFFPGFIFWGSKVIVVKCQKLLIYADTNSLIADQKEIIIIHF